MKGAALHNNIEVSFSWHARQRLEQRQLDLSEQELDRLEKAVGALSRKGGKLSLVLLDQLAMLVSIVNRRVITVAGQEQLEQNVFTNIDSAAVA
ncbi:flagellar operon protein [Desulfuromusa kysingii]|uniref:Flagellar operon protein n=1 Tax=Desulfuromusa kysingii TaxID=37625 RepID=A0A1H3W0U8_9BACT|nr:hypothetical protein [Desulfuromusa kysingii]SDZ79952.1 flagellar operon protein [Desulfuromusa kysingii]